MNVLDLIHAVPEVEKRLADDMSRKIYDMRMKYLIYRDVFSLRDDIKKLNVVWRQKPDVKKFLNDNKPKKIIIFGAGEWGRETLKIFQASEYKNYEISFCDNSFKKLRGAYGIDVMSPAEAFKIKDSVIVIGSNIYRKSIKRQILDSGYPEERVCNPIVENNGWEYFDYFEPNENEIFVDAGCYNGGTAVNFVKWATKGYDYIYSFEANPHAITKCKETFKKYELKGELIDKGLWNKKDILKFAAKLDSDASGANIAEDGEESIETISLDEVLDGRRVTFIKMDIEGAEYNALIGSEKTIRNWNPRLAICVYHKPEDIVEIPALLLKMNNDYKFALRQYDSWDTSAILYAY